MAKINDNYYVSEYETPVGKVYMAADEAGLVGLWIEGQLHFAKILGGAEAVEKALACDEGGNASKPKAFRLTRRWLDIYFQGREPDFTPPLHFIGTDFQIEVWEILMQIPYGETTIYGEIAEELAQRRGIKRMSAQAVGGAVGRNNISIIVPCHRVIGADGSLTGYAGGTDIKAKLLRIEGAQWKE